MFVVIVRTQAQSDAQQTSVWENNNNDNVDTYKNIINNVDVKVTIINKRYMQSQRNRLKESTE